MKYQEPIIVEQDGAVFAIYLSADPIIGDQSDEGVPVGKIVGLIPNEMIEK